MNQPEKCTQCDEVHIRCMAHRKAKNSADGKIHPCNRWPKHGTRNCPVHNGATKTRGSNHGNFKSGRFSKYLPKALDQQLQQLKEARQSADYFSLTEQIDLVELRISQLCSQLNTASSSKTWEDIEQARLDIMDAVKNNNPDKLTAALRTLESISAQGKKEYRAWDEVFKVQRHYNTLIQSERKKLIEDRLMLRVDEVYVMLRMIGEAVNEIKDVNDKQRLFDRIRLLSAQAGYEIEASRRLSDRLLSPDN